MAGLKKPNSCSCGSTEFYREFHPERWICSGCSIVVATRKPKATTGICSKCGKKKSSSVAFKEGKNSCLDCYNQYMRDWRDTNKDDQRKKKKKYYKDNRVRLRKQMNAYWQSSVKTYASDLMHRIKTLSRRTMGGKPRNLKVDIDKKFLIELWNTQDGLCAISKVPMEHKWGLVASGSVDRIDSSKGYIRNNVQLVCKGINLMKNTHTNKEIFAFLDAYYDHRAQRVSNLVADYERSKQIEESEVFPHVADDIVM